jgi:hypothetical protein
VNSAYVSAISVLLGSAIGALASLAATWLTQRYQGDVQRRAQEKARRELIFVEFIDSSSKAFVDALLQTAIKDPSKIIPLYTTFGKLRLFASEQTVEAAEKVMNHIVETYYGPKFDLETKPSVDDRFDFLREFVERCRAELRGY